LKQGTIDMAASIRGGILQVVPVIASEAKRAATVGPFVRPQPRLPLRGLH
jgi:hypothetical protein